MKKKNTIIGAAALAVALTVGGGVALAGGHGGGRGGFGGFMLKRIVKTLDLDERQEALAKEIKQDLRNKHRESRQSMHESMQTLRAEVAKASPDKAKIHALIDAQAAKKTAMAHYAADRVLEVHGTLTDTQRGELIKAVDSMHERMQERRARRKGRRGKRGGEGAAGGAEE